MEVYLNGKIVAVVEPLPVSGRRLWGDRATPDLSGSSPVRVSNHCWLYVPTRYYRVRLSRAGYSDYLEDVDLDGEVYLEGEPEPVGADNCGTTPAAR